MTVYTPAIPQGGDIISQSQPLILGNFQSLNTSNSVNHVAFNDANQGKHKFLQMPDQSSDPTTAANELALYSKELSAVSTLYFRKESDGTVIQLTGIDPVKALEGTTFLPGGVVLKWGTATINVAASTVNFAAPTFPNAVYSLALTVGNSSTAAQQVVYTGLNQGGFTGYGTANGLFCTYIAIGS